MALPAQEFKMPQAIAHRGHKAAFPENSMGAFRAAVEVGAHAIETDLHLSRDGVVVLSHVRRIPIRFIRHGISLLFVGRYAEEVFR